MVKETSKVIGIIGIICAIVFPIGGLILGIIGLNIKKPKDKDLRKKAIRLNVIAIVLSILVWFGSFLYLMSSSL